MAIFQLDDRIPQIDPTAWVAEQAIVIGSVTLGPHASVWFHSTLRGDNDPIVLGENANIQESCVLHTDHGCPLTIGKGVTVGHQAMLHGCTIGEGSLIGIQAVVLNGARIGKHCLIGAGAIITEGKEIPDRSLVIGAPGKVARTLTDEEVARLSVNNGFYVRNAERFRTGLKRLA